MISLKSFSQHLSKEPIMRKALIVPAVAAVLALSACDTGTPLPVPTTAPATVIETVTQERAPERTTTERTAPKRPARTTAPAAVDNDTIFIAAIDDDIPGAGQGHINAAKAVCEAMDDGNSLEAVLLEALDADSGLTPSQVGVLIGAGIAVYCPQHADQIPAE